MVAKVHNGRLNLNWHTTRRDSRPCCSNTVLVCHSSINKFSIFTNLFITCFAQKKNKSKITRFFAKSNAKGKAAKQKPAKKLKK